MREISTESDEEKCHRPILTMPTSQDLKRSGVFSRNYLITLTVLNFILSKRRYIIHTLLSLTCICKIENVILKRKDGGFLEN